MEIKIDSSVDKTNTFISKEISKGKDSAESSFVTYRDKTLDKLLPTTNNLTSINPLDFGLKVSEESIGKNHIYYDKIEIRSWNNTENISARLIEFSDIYVVLECLIDKEENHYEEREFKVSLFEGYNLEVGKLFYIRFFERQHEMRIEILDNPALVSKSDFPKIDFAAAFKQSKLFNKI